MVCKQGFQLHRTHHFSSVQSLSHVRLFEIPWTAAHQASLPSATPEVYSNSCPLSQWCHPTISSSVIPFSSGLRSFPSSGFFSDMSVLHIRWPKYWSFIFSINPSNEYSKLIFFRMDLLDLLSILMYSWILTDSTYLFLMMTLIKRYDCDHHLKMWKSMCWEVNERAP